MTVIEWLKRGGGAAALKVIYQQAQTQGLVSVIGLFGMGLEKEKKWT